MFTCGFGKHEQVFEHKLLEKKWESFSKHEKEEEGNVWERKKMLQTILVYRVDDGRWRHPLGTMDR